MVSRELGEMTKVDSFVRFEKEEDFRCAKLFPRIENVFIIYVFSKILYSTYLALQFGDISV